jgi:SAM-dependent methyltransferase
MEEPAKLQHTRSVSCELSCELCGYAGDMAPHFPGKGIVKCPRCNLVFFASDGADPSSLYTDEYFSGGEYLDYVAERKVHQWNFADRIRDVRRYAPSGNLFEIGCAYGFFLDLARAHWKVRGVDITPSGIQHARSLGLDATCVDFLDMPDEPESQDAICLWDTIEHLPRPVKAIQKAARWLKRGGVLFATTGDAGSLVARVRGERWRQIHPPTHLYYFSTETLSHAARSAELEVVAAPHVGYARSAKAMLYIMLALRGGFSQLYRTLTFGERLDFPVYLNLYDIVMLVARKP